MAGNHNDHGKSINSFREVCYGSKILLSKSIKFLIVNHLYISQILIWLPIVSRPADSND